MTLAISIEDLSKAYRIGLKDEIPDTLVAAGMSWIKKPFRNIKRLTRLNTFKGTDEADLHWALRDISLDIQQSEVVGIIGHNGAGKSTLLKVLSRITQPTSGRAVIRGRVSSLLEVGTGFHPELSGRENIYLNGTILGMRKSEIDQKFDEIVAFSGVEKFLETPIKRYSSGMRVRLAFAVAAHLEPEILVIDEVLAVGDQQFQDKCLGKMQEVAGSGRTVLFVSHNMAAVEALCSRAVLLKGGQVVGNGPVADITTQYLNPGQGELSGGIGNFECEDGLIRAVRLLDASGQVTEQVATGAPIRFEIELNSDEPLRGLTIRVVLTSQSGVRVFNCNSRIETNRLIDLGSAGRVTCSLPNQRLSPSRYFVSVGVFYHGQELQSAEPAFAFDIVPTDIFGTGLMPPAHKAVYLPVCDWSFEEIQT